MMTFGNAQPVPQASILSQLALPTNRQVCLAFPWTAMCSQSTPPSMQCINRIQLPRTLTFMILWVLKFELCGFFMSHVLARSRTCSVATSVTNSLVWLATLMRMSAFQRYTRRACVPQPLGIINHVSRIYKFDVVNLMRTDLDNQAPTPCLCRDDAKLLCTNPTCMSWIFWFHIFHLSNPCRPTCIVNKSCCPCKQCGLMSCLTTRR